MLAYWNIGVLGYLVDGQPSFYGYGLKRLIGYSSPIIPSRHHSNSHWLLCYGLHPYGVAPVPGLLLLSLFKYDNTADAV